MLNYQRTFRNTYASVVGRVFLYDNMYGFKYRPNIGTYPMPYLYVKTLFLCATGGGLHQDEMRYIRGLVDTLLPCKASYPVIKQELLKFVDSVPLMSGPPRSSRADSSRPQHNAAGAASTEVNAAPKTLESSSKGDNAEGHTQSFPRAEDHQERANPTKEVISSTKEPLFNKLMEDNDDAALFRSNPELAMKCISPEAFSPALSRILVYDAVCACVADNLYGAKERERVAMVATQIGLSPAVREPIEMIALQEKALSNRKRLLLHLHRDENVGATLTFWANPSGEAPAKKRSDIQGKSSSAENNTSTSVEEGGARVGNFKRDVSYSACAGSSGEKRHRMQTGAGEIRARPFHESYACFLPSLKSSVPATSSVDSSPHKPKDLLRQAKALLRHIQSS